MQRVIVVTTRSEDQRKHFNVLWSDVLIVESEILQFDEPEFDTNDFTMEEVADRLRDIGYRVTEPHCSVLVAGKGF